MEKYSPMDILRAPTHEEVIVSSFREWIQDHSMDKNEVTTFTFKKNTPDKILRSYKHNYALFDKLLGFKVSPTYKIAKNIKDGNQYHWYFAVFYVFDTY